MPKRIPALLALLAAVLLLTAGSALAQSKKYVGRWVASVNGQRIVLQLNADGTGSIDGEPGRWSSRGKTVYLHDDDGNKIPATVSGDTLTVTIQGQTIVFSRTGTSVAKLEKFKPKKLKGKRVKPKGSSASFTVPRGWKHGWTKNEGKDVYAIKPKSLDATIMLERYMLAGANKDMTVKQLLTSSVYELLEGARVDTVEGPDTFKVNGHAAGRLVIRATVRGKKLEGYVAGVVIDGWAFSLVGLYQQSDSDHVRAGLDTMLATFKAKPPKQNRKLLRSLPGCWEDYTSNSSGSGSGSSQVKLRIKADGTWTRYYFMSVSVAGASTTDEKNSHGTWTIFGNELALTAVKGDSLNYTVRLKGGFLYLNGTKYLPCS